MDKVMEKKEIKEKAREVLEAAMRSRRQTCVPGTGALSDPYMPLESQLDMTRGMLQLAQKHGFGVTVLTKSASILRDLDVLTQINDSTKAVVQMTLTTYDEKLCKLIEPNVSTTRERLDALRCLRDAGIPTVVWLCPILPFINDTPENIMGFP